MQYFYKHTYKNKNDTNLYFLCGQASKIDKKVNEKIQCKIPFNIKCFFFLFYMYFDRMVIERKQHIITYLNKISLIMPCFIEENFQQCKSTRKHRTI